MEMEIGLGGARGRDGRLEEYHVLYRARTVDR